MSWTGRIWFYPGGSGSLEEIEIPPAVSVADLQETLDPLGAVSDSLGQRTFVVQGNDDRVTISITQFSDDDLRRSLLSLDRHLKTGWRIAFAGVEAKAWGGWLSALPVQGDTLVDTWGNAFGPLTSSTAAIAIGDEVVISGPPMPSWREMRKVSAVTGATRFTLSQPLFYDYAAHPVFLRHRDFWPMLVYAGPLAAQLLTTDRRRVYSWQAEFRIDWVALAGMYEAGPGDITLYGEGQIGAGTTFDGFRLSSMSVSQIPGWEGGRQ